ncbi:ATP-binding domain-containing protein [Vibrio parahaemolyticus]|nr:ATP-binding domain-containing protein [Vibrio parahaemolyticus]MDF4671498.1 ATP-binding domain-containing protein [Vibrio parahaemolyticus]HAV1411525.1 AAA family ATPase [Vibrio parahaemolyticus]HAV1416032.1 AAA family ATPase [Vibrio parahaemolyticus]HAV2005395.1 AAA family ATPase [Vibrio parahaemolyticus]
MSEYCFFTPESQALAESSNLKETLEQYAEQNKKQIYVLSRPLSKEDLTYEYEHAFVIFASGYKPCFVDTADNEKEFEEFVEDFIDDMAFLSEKFEYRKKIGRKKRWLELIETKHSHDLDLNALVLENPTDKRVADLLTSLVIGSINDVSRVNLEANNLLDSIKSKIVLFDTDQTGFVFKMGASKKFVIQGLAGSGKTELLLHKLKEVYSNEQDARIAFTCFNKILASSMKSRIPEFFDFMKVERQIDWENKLFCFHSWGSGRFPNSGMYRYICHKYEIPFGTFSAGSFDQLCKKAIEDIKSVGESNGHKFIFDYVFIDESQDFGEHFVELCELVTEKKVFVAGDVFQNIFRTIDESVSHADLVLKKCYRTDPKNLMFSHALGMGLYEEPVLRWLQDNEWSACGYNFREEGGRAIIGRDPLRRFEDIPQEFQSTTIHLTPDSQSISDSIFNVVEQIKARHSSVEPGDIAVLFLDKGKYIYDVIPKLANSIAERLGWDVNISHESKTSDATKFFISNINNAKGLEFPFVICFAKDLRAQPAFRNGLYTMMARSFLESHLVLGSQTDQELLSDLNSGLECIINNGYMDLRIPSAEEIENQKTLIVWDEEPSLEDRVVAYCEEHGASPRLKAKIIQRMAEVMGDVEYEEDYFNVLINAEFKRFEKL